MGYWFPPLGESKSWSDTREKVEVVLLLTSQLNLFVNRFSRQVHYEVDEYVVSVSRSVIHSFMTQKRKRKSEGESCLIC